MKMLHVVGMGRRIPLCLVVGVLLAGCTAQMMETRGDQVELFRLPSAQPGRGGIIRYNDRGRTSWRVARRKDAEKQMVRFCQGTYTITQEGPRSQFNLRSGIPVDALDPNRYIAFDCAKPAEPTVLKQAPWPFR